MPRRPYSTVQVRIELRVTSETAIYLDDLVAVGIHGNNRSEIAKVLVGREIERLISEDVLHLHRRKSRG